MTVCQRFESAHELLSTKVKQSRPRESIDCHCAMRGKRGNLPKPLLGLRQVLKPLSGGLFIGDPMARKAKTSSAQWLGIPAFPIPIFNGKLVLCTLPEEWDSMAAAFDDITGTDGCKGLAMRYYSEEHGRVYAIGVFDQAIDTLVHELAHATFFLLGDVGIPVASGEDNESFTYILGYMMREVFPVFLAKTKR